jgi:hypothetical protein
VQSIRDRYVDWMAINGHSHNWEKSQSGSDWAVLGGSKGDTSYVFASKTYKVYNRYKKAVNSLLSSNSNNCRLLTDTEFAGQSFGNFIF